MTPPRRTQQETRMPEAPDTAPPGAGSTPAPAAARPADAGAPMGPLHWRQIVDWLRADGVITSEEAQRTINRCAHAESSQHPLVRLGAVAIQRASDGKPLDTELLTEYVAGRAGLQYLRIDRSRSTWAAWPMR